MKIGIIGFGNLGRSLASGIVKSGAAEKSDIFICDSSDAAAAAARDTGLFVSSDAADIIQKSDAVFLTVKSYVFEQIAQTLQKDVFGGKTVVSFMAGMDFDKIQAAIGNVNLVRGMPSLAIATCDGVIGYTKAPDEVSALFHKLGYAFEVAPEEIEKVMAFSSCGLGFAAYMLGAFVKAGMDMGFSREESVVITEKTFKNAIDRGEYEKTVEAVATKGGATEQGVLHMKEHKLPEIVSGALQKAYDRMK